MRTHTLPRTLSCRAGACLPALTYNLASLTKLAPLLFLCRCSAPAPAPAQFFGRPTYLTVSGQLYGEMLASSLSRVYTFGPTFRAEQSNTVRHLNEFWMLEPEMAHAGWPHGIAAPPRFAMAERSKYVCTVLWSRPATHPTSLFIVLRVQCACCFQTWTR